MRVALVTNLYPPLVRGGAEVSAETLARALIGQGHDVLVLTLAPTSVPGPEQRRVLEVRRPYDAWQDQPRPPSLLAKATWHALELADGSKAGDISAAVRDFGASLVLTQNLTGLGSRTLGGLSRLLPSEVPVIHTLRDYGLLCVRSTRYHHGRTGCEGHVACGLVRRVSGRQARGVAGVVGLSRHVLDVHRRHGLFAGIPARVIPNAVSDGAGAGTADRSFLGYLGRISEEKGVFDLVRAYRRALDAGAALPPLHLAGSGAAADLAEVDRLGEGLPVTRVGQVPSGPFLGSLRLLVVPSRWEEPFGRVVIEAGAHETPVVVSDAGGLPEAATEVLEDPEDLRKVVFPAGDVDALASRLTELARGGIPGTQRPSRTADDVATDYLRFAGELAPWLDTGVPVDGAPEGGRGR